MAHKISLVNLTAGQADTFLYFIIMSQSQVPNAVVVPDKGIHPLAVKSSPDFREQFLSFIKESYPGIRQLKFKSRNNCWFYVVRGEYGPKSLYARGYTPEAAASHFLKEILRKVIQTPPVIDRYYASLDIG